MAYHSITEGKGKEMFTIADLLKLPDIQGIRLLAGAGGVENEISRTNIMDNPDTFDWLISGELLLSTGYIFREDEELQRRLIHRVAQPIDRKSVV